MKKLLVTLCVGAVLLSACASEDVTIIEKQGPVKKHKKMKKQDNSDIIYNK